MAAAGKLTQRVQGSKRTTGFELAQHLGWGPTGVIVCAGLLEA